MLTQVTHAKQVVLGRVGAITGAFCIGPVCCNQGGQSAPPAEVFADLAVFNWFIEYQ